MLLFFYRFIFILKYPLIYTLYLYVYLHLYIFIFYYIHININYIIKIYVIFT